MAELHNPKTAIAFPGTARAVKNEKTTSYIVGHCFDEFGRDCDPTERLSSRMRDFDEIARNIPIMSGSYALAIVAVDRTFACLIADPLATEPIYFSDTIQNFAFSFKLRDLVSHLNHREFDGRGLDEITRYRWLEEDRTLISGIRQILPGHIVYWRQGQHPIIQRYTRVQFTPAKKSGDQREFMTQTNEALDRSLSQIRSRHSRIAVFFSGGVDSSLLLAKAREHGFEKLLAVTGDYPGFENPETVRAKQISKLLGVPLTLIPVEGTDVANIFPKLTWFLERPNAYTNNLVRAKLFQALSSEVSLVLTGECADGMFGTDAGRNATEYAREQAFIDWVPQGVRVPFAKALALSSSQIGRGLSQKLLTNTIGFIRSKGTLLAQDEIGDGEIARLLPQLLEMRAADSTPFYSIFEGDGASPSAICQNRGLHSQNRNQFYCYSKLAEPYGVKVEHPFVSPPLTSIGLTLPDSQKWDNRGAKPILKKLLSKYIPEDLVYAKKLGFVTPGEQWRKGPLAGWIDILSEERTIKRGLFSEDVLRGLKADNSLAWTAISLEIFARQFVDLDTALQY